jgi:hypothetical protein
MMKNKNSFLAAQFLVPPLVNWGLLTILTKTTYSAKITEPSFRMIEHVLHHYRSPANNGHHHKKFFFNLRSHHA